MTIYVIHHSHTDVGYTDTQESEKRCRLSKNVRILSGIAKAVGVSNNFWQRRHERKRINS